MRITIDLPRPKSLLAATVTIVVFASIMADASVPNTFNAGDVLSAAKVNANFADIDSWRAHPVVSKNGKQFSLGATYCGSTSTTTGQITGGRVGAKTSCETVCTSASAHVCTSTELIRTADAGLSVPSTGWYASSPSGDCSGWTSAASNITASCFNNGAYCSGGGLPAGYNYASCNYSFPVLCCD